MRSSSFFQPLAPMLNLLFLITMWGFFGHQAIAQNTTAVRPTTAAAVSASAVSSAATANTSPVLTMNTPTTVTACGTTRLTWTIANQPAAVYLITLRLVNDGVDQTIPSSSAISSAPAASAQSSTLPVTSAAASRPASSAAASIAASSPAPTSPAATAATSATLSKRVEVNTVLVTGQNASVGYDWKVQVPQGRYFLYGSINDTRATYAKTAVFTVLEGSDTSCLAAFNSASGSATGSSTGSTVATSAAADDNAGQTNGKGGISSGAIAGIAIGAVAAIAIATLLAFCCLRRRRSSKGDGAENAMGPEMKHRNRSSSFGHTFAANVVPGGKNRHSRHQTTSSGGGHIALTSMGGSSEGYEKDDSSHEGTSYISEGATVLGNHRGYPDPSPSSRPNPFATAPNTPQGRDVESFPSADYAVLPSSKADRRQSGPATSPTKTSGLDRGHSRNRSNSQPSNGQSGKIAMGRTPSQRRKPVPSLGAELRSEMQRQASSKSRRSRGDSQQTPPEEGTTEMLRQSYQLMPDPPRAINE